MFLINIFVSIPFASEKRILLGDDLAVEEGRQGGKLLGKAFDFEVATQVAVLLVHVLSERKREEAS